MTKMLLVVALIGVGTVLARAERPTLGRGEAPRATDLLRAEKLAEQAERRLKMPAPRGAKWKKGGAGWDARGEGAAESSEPVIINVRPPRRRPAP